MSETGWAKAHVAVEPYLGYSQFNFEVNGSTSSDSKYGAVLGGKGGLEISDMAFVALDYHLGGPYLLENNVDNEYLTRMWGVGAAIISRNIRIWFGYYYDVELDDVDRGLIYEGTAIKLSLGHEFKSKLSVNLEYVKMEIDDARGDMVFTPIQISVDLTMLSISAPIYLN